MGAGPGGGALRGVWRYGLIIIPIEVMSGQFPPGTGVPRGVIFIEE